jgi:carbon-monoxide dehydrogenase small subunit
MLVDEKHVLKLKVNGRWVERLVAPHWTLLEFLRDDLKLTGTNQSCDTGDCGACTVLMDGEPYTSCLMLALDAEGRDVVTIEGLAKGDELHPVQKAFLLEGGAQCGFCTPGMVMAAVGLLNQNPNPTEAEIRAGLEGNLCRCTGYVKIFRAVQTAARVMQEATAHGAN